MYKSELNELGYKFWFSVLVNHYVRSGRAENPDQKVTKANISQYMKGSGTVFTTLHFLRNLQIDPIS